MSLARAFLASKFTPPIRCIVVSLGKFLFWLSLLCIPLYFAACSNPSGGDTRPATYTVTFDRNGGDTNAVPVAKIVTAPATHIDTLPVPPVRAGHSFAGWNTRSDGYGNTFTASTTVSANITVYAQWTVISSGPYVVTFKLNDGTENILTSKTVTATTIPAADFPANPTRTGYNFAGWNTAANGSESPFTASTAVSANITVYAQWTAAPPSGSFTVAFRLNDGTETNWAARTVTPPVDTVTGENFPANPTRTGYIFTGWNAAPDGSGTSFTALTIVNINMTVYAQWTGETYTVLFKQNDDTDATLHTKTVTVPATTIAAVDFPANPSRTGYNFTGWNTTPDGSGATFTASTTVSGDMTVYAQWTAPLSPGSFAITFRLNDETETNWAARTVTPPVDTITEENFPANPSRTDYIFTGWNTAPDGSGSPFTASTIVNDNITVYAQWTGKTYTAHFKQNDGTDTIIHSKTITVPTTTIDTADFPADPTRTGYTFVGWNAAAGGSGSPFTASTTVNADITVYAQWTGETYTALFNSNDGTDTTLHTKTVTVPATTIDTADFPANPSRTGYNFEGWNTAPDGSGSPFTASTTVNGDMTVYAQWTALPPPSSFTVTFKLNDETETNWTARTVTFPVDTIAGENFPDNPSRTGYTFTGWNTAPDGLGTPFTVSTTISGNMTVYAQWAGETYTVLFNSNDGTDATLHTKTVTVPATTIDSADFPANPSRIGYIFAGWNTAAGGSGSPFAASTTVSGDMTVYAQWTGETYTVIFHQNDGTDVTLHTKTVTMPATTIDAADFPDNPTRTGYSFAGWNTAAGGSGSPFTASTTVSADVTVYAQWTGETYTVTFKSNDGTDTTLHAKTVTVPATTIDAVDFPADPTRTGGYTFAGWNTAAGGSGSPFAASTTVNADITVYAQWIGDIHTILFNSNDGMNTTLHTKTVTVPATTIGAADFPADPTRTGYIFEGWNTAPAGSGSPFAASTTVNADITVYAQWIGETYTVTFKRNDGTDATLYAETVTVPATTIDAANFPADPTRTGYTFTGWNTAPAGSGSPFIASTTVSADMTVYARWTAVSPGFYTVIFKLNDGTEATWAAKIVTPPVDTVIVGDFPSAPSRTGYTFTGWNTAVNGLGTSFTVSTIVNVDIIVYAQWTATVTFKSNDGTDTTLDTKTVAMPAAAIPEADFPTNPTRTGYTFAGWNTVASGSGSSFTALTIVNADITVYAQWTGETYTVLFKHNDGTGATLHTKTVTVPATTIGTADFPANPTRTGYIFAGWNTAPTGSGSAFTASTPVNSDMTVYARWTGALITLNPDIGDGAFSQETFTISKSGVNGNQTISVTDTDYTNPRWLVDRILKGTEMSITISAADYGLGGHNLTLIINKNGVSWSKEISFTVAN